MNSDLVRPTNKLKDLLPQLSLEFCSNLPKGEIAGPPAALSKCLPFTATILHTNTFTSYISRCYIHWESCAMHQVLGQLQSN